MMPLDTIAIVGVGLIGGSIGLAVKQRGLARHVIGVGHRAATLNRARRLGAIDRGTTRIASVAGAELVVFCTPVDVIAEQAKEAAMHVSTGTIFTDAGSTKRRIVELLDGALPDGVSFVGGHPLAGSEKRGVAAARGDLFTDRVCVLTKTARTPPATLAMVQQFWQSLGAHVIVMSPEAHDRAVAYTSHLPHLAAAALSILLPDRYRELAASGFRDTTRIAASDPRLWTAIFLENAEPLLDALAGYERTIVQFRRALETRDARRLNQLWTRSKSNREAIAMPEETE